MSKKFEKIDEALNIESPVIEVQAEEVREISSKIIKNSKSIKKTNQKDEVDLDYDYSRTNNYELTSTINDVIYEMFEIAKNSQKARDFEVVGQLIKIAKEIDDGYLDRQQKMKKLKEQEESKKSTVTNQTTNAVFVGSTAALQQFLKESAKNK
ncbi:MAG: terminase [Candidatus Lokiarchaeota archaeon]|nr:terminase [Candidatus Lokiarchaeota archaeon]